MLRETKLAFLKQMDAMKRTENMISYLRPHPAASSIMDIYHD
jgi:hypothetical protein